MFMEKDFMSEPETRLQFSEEDFVYSFDFIGDQGLGGNTRPSFVANNPFLGTLPGNGFGQSIVTLTACGINLPHHHPRATETIFVTKGPSRSSRSSIANACM
jgi:hypothetical protein